MPLTSHRWLPKPQLPVLAARITTDRPYGFIMRRAHADRAQARARRNSVGTCKATEEVRRLSATSGADGASPLTVHTHTHVHARGSSEDIYLIFTEVSGAQSRLISLKCKSL